MSRKKKPLLVTGGAGFIGSHFVKWVLKESNNSVLVLDKLTYCGNKKNLAGLEKTGRFQFVKGDIGNPRILSRLLPRVKGVVNFAAETHVDRSIVDPGEFLKTNIISLRIFLENCLRYRVPRFLHISTDEVYGPIQRGSALEIAPLNPMNPYSASKAAGDLLIKSYVNTFGFPALIARSANNYGPYQYPEKVIPLFVTNLIEGKKVPLYSKGENIRDWLFVEDNVRGIWFIYRKGKVGEIYNVGAGNERTNREMTHNLLKAFGKNERSIQYVKDRPGHDYRYSVNFTKTKRLGFRPRVSFPAGLKRTIQWYQTHEAWWKPLKNNRFTKK